MRVHKKFFTKAERRFVEILKRHHIPYQAKVRVGGREIDFIVGRVAIEIGNHPQNRGKNKHLLESGYSLLFISNTQLKESPNDVAAHLLTHWI